MTPAPHRPATAPFRITKAGLYRTRGGRTVEVKSRDDSRSLRGFRWTYDHPTANNPTIRDDGRWDASGCNRLDIVAKVPATPAPVKKARRRYVVRAMRGDLGWCVFDREGNPHGPYLALEMSRADARAFCRMKEAQRGGE